MTDDRVAVDDIMLSLHGRLGIDYRVVEHSQRLGGVVETARKQLIDEIRSGRSVVLDHGLGRRAERDDYKRLANELCANWHLVHFMVDIEILCSRCADRFDDPDSVPTTDQMLTHMAEAWEPPSGDGEIVVDGCWRPQHP